MLTLLVVFAAVAVAGQAGEGRTCPPAPPVPAPRDEASRRVVSAVFLIAASAHPCVHFVTQILTHRLLLVLRHFHIHTRHPSLQSWRGPLLYTPRILRAPKLQTLWGLGLRLRFASGRASSTHAGSRRLRQLLGWIAILSTAHTRTLGSRPIHGTMLTLLEAFIAYLSTAQVRGLASYEWAQSLSRTRSHVEACTGHLSSLRTLTAKVWVAHLALLWPLYHHAAWPHQPTRYPVR